MRSKHDPRDCLADIIENIGLIGSYMSGMDHNGFRRDRRTRDAVERCLERICEAAFRLGDMAAGLIPDQPWGDIRGMGNWLRHGYDGINLDIIWNTVQNRLPGLKADAERALTRLQSDSARPEGKLR